MFVDPRDVDMESFVQSLIAMLNDAPDGSSIRLDRDSARALVGGYQMAIACVDQIGAALRDLRQRVGPEAVDEVLDHHAIDLGLAR